MRRHVGFPARRAGHVGGDAGAAAEIAFLVHRCSSEPRSGFDGRARNLHVLGRRFQVPRIVGNHGPWSRDGVGVFHGSPRAENTEVQVFGPATSNSVSIACPDCNCRFGAPPAIRRWRRAVPRGTHPGHHGGGNIVLAGVDTRGSKRAESSWAMRSRKSSQCIMFFPSTRSAPGVPSHRRASFNTRTSSLLAGHLASVGTPRHGGRSASEGEHSQTNGAEAAGLS